MDGDELAEASKEELLGMYRRISERLTDSELLARLRAMFGRKATVSELLDWVHARIRFNKGEIDRHNDPFEIIEYGQGRCREFSVLFTAVSLANGYRARLILDMSDHVWVEVWDEKGERWVHVDPSERRVDDPEMYERDWKKNLEEVYAFDKGDMEDVTGNYKQKHEK